MRLPCRGPHRPRCWRQRPQYPSDRTLQTPSRQSAQRVIDAGRLTVRSIIERAGGVGPWSVTMSGLFKLIVAVALALVLWLWISGTSILPFPSNQQPPEPTPALASATGAPTAADIAKLNDSIAKLTAAVDKLNQQLAERDSVRPSGNSSRPSADTLRRQEIDARQSWRRLSWRDPPCWW
jgi:hypothetical protein